MRVEWQGETLGLRPVSSAEEGLVFQTWIRSYRPTMKDVGVAEEPYHLGQRARVARLWRATWIAFREEAPEAVHAWVCGAPGLLHYVYVPFELRRMGLAKTLVRAVCGDELEFTHRWPFEARPRGWRPNEYRLEET